MPLLRLEIPPGVFRNGTDYESSGRWRDASLVRWQNNSLRPVGGWELREASATTEPPRGAVTWVDNSGDIHYAMGTASKLFTSNAGNTIVDITPAGLTTGNVDAQENLAFGGSFYGTAYYGVARPSGIPQECTTWSLDNWGEYLIACSTDDGKVYEWQLNNAVDAQVVSNAPVDNLSVIVSEERFLFCLGAGGNPRKVQWSDREDNTTWTPLATNEAGDIELQTSGEIMCGVRIRGRMVILTNVDAHVATYSGPPIVYGFERVGTACGTISRMGAVAVDEGAFWIGSKGFFAYNGSSVQELPCEVSDYVFNDMNQSQRSKVVAVHNSQYGEVWWFYPSASSLENDRYVAYDYKEQHWLIGELSRTAAVDRGVFRHPIWFDAAGNIYNHEVGNSHHGSSIFVESGPVSLGAGDQIMKVNQLIPDELTQGQVSATFKTRFYPNDTEREYGPYDMSNPTSVRFSGRQVRMRLDGDDLADWRAGVMRIEARPGGKR